MYTAVLWQESRRDDHLLGKCKDMYDRYVDRLGDVSHSFVEGRDSSVDRCISCVGRCARAVDRCISCVGRCARAVDRCISCVGRCARAVGRCESLVERCERHVTDVLDT